MPNLKAPLKALAAKLFASPVSKGELVTRPVVEDALYDAVSQGSPGAVQALSKALGVSEPRDRDGLQKLLTEVEPSRRGFLRGMMGAGAHLIAPSPLRLLNETAEALGPRLTVELSPMELMEYSKKYLDRSILTPGNSNLRYAEDVDEAGRNFLESHSSVEEWTPANISMKNLLKRFTIDPTRESTDHILKGLDLSPTEQNIKSLEIMADGIYPFDPMNIGAEMDNLGSGARDFAEGQWEDVGILLNDITSDFGVYDGLRRPESDPSLINLDPEWKNFTEESSRRTTEFEKNFEDFLDRLHKPDKPPKIPPITPHKGHIAARRDLDQLVSEEAYDRGYIEDDNSGFFEDDVED